MIEGFLSLPPKDPMTQIVLTEDQIVSAMKHYEKLAGPRDGITICKQVSKLADLLAIMWCEHEKEALVRADSAVAVLVREALATSSVDAAAVTDEVDAVPDLEAEAVDEASDTAPAP